MKKLGLSLIVIALLIVSNISNSQWYQQNSGTNVVLHDIYFLNASTGFAVGDSAIIIKTTNGGANWSTVKPPGYGELFTIKFLNANTGWVGGGKHVIMNAYRTQAFYTTDGGNTWTSAFPPYMTEWRFTDVEVFDLDNVIFTSSQCNDNVCSGDIVKTTNRGQNWTSVTNINGYYEGLNWINNQTGWAVTNFWNDVPPAVAHILITTNNGQNWNIIFTEIDSLSGIDLSFTAVQFLDANTGYLLKGLPFGSTQLRKSSNSGNSWVTVDSLSQRYWDLFFINKDTGWMSGRYASNALILRTANGGQNWSQQLTGAGGIVWKIFFVDANNGWALNQTKIFHTTNGGITGVKLISTNSPDEFRLLQNFPNPFNPTTTIRYDIKTKGNVELKVFDLLGRELTSLVNENQTPGTYEVVFDASSLPSGVYFYRLKAGDFVDSKKMVVLK